jgi:large subunit ribosomal protein L22
MDIKAKLNYYRMSPRKVRLVADLIRGKKTDDAVAQLTFCKKRSAPTFLKLLKSALSNAKNNFKTDTDKDNLYIKEIRVDEGPTLKRWRPVSRGMAHSIKKRTSHISIVLGEQ